MFSERGYEMDSTEYCKLMTNFKSNGLKFSLYMGKKWFISKFIILFAGAVMVLNKDKVVNVVGYVLMGYFLGMVLANVRNFILSKKRWDLQKEFLDWEKIKEVIAQSQ